MTEALVEVLRAYGTCAVSDALDMIGYGAGGLPGLTRMSGTGPVAGPAYTLRYTAVEPGRAAPAGEFVDDVPPGAVVVIESGRPDCTVWGDLLTEVAVRDGVAGTVVDGLCRDVGDIREIGYPLWSLGAYMKSGKHRVRLDAVQEPVVVRGTTVSPGDVVVGDDSGCLVVPVSLAAEAARAVERVAEAERRIREDLAAGMSLREARERRGYNALGLVRP